jgi:hypothetical protein
MQRHILAGLTAFIIAAAAFAAPVLAASSDSTSLSLTGFAGEVCKLSGQTQGGATENASYSNGLYTITSFIDPDTAFPRASSGTITLTQAYCNYGTKIEITSENKGLKNTGSQVAPSDFITKVDYTITATWGSLQLPVLNTATTPNGTISLDSGAANKGDIVLEIRTPNIDAPALNGQFNDVIKIKIGATI